MLHVCLDIHIQSGVPGLQPQLPFQSIAYVCSLQEAFCRMDKAVGLQVQDPHLLRCVSTVCCIEALLQGPFSCLVTSEEPALAMQQSQSHPHQLPALEGVVLQ